MYYSYVKSCLEALSLECSKKDLASNDLAADVYARLRDLEKLALKIKNVEQEITLFDAMRLDYPKGSPKLLIARVKLYFHKKKFDRLHNKFWK